MAIVLESFFYLFYFKIIIFKFSSIFVEIIFLFILEINKKIEAAHQNDLLVRIFDSGYFDCHNRIFGYIWTFSSS